MSGTFHGVIAATTPSGRGMTSAPPACSGAGGCSAYQRADAAVQATSPSASARRLPTSRTISSASPVASASTVAAKRRRAAARSSTGVAAH